MKIIKYKNWYQELSKELNKLDKKEKLTNKERMKYDEILDNIDYIYRCNGYT